MKILYLSAHSILEFDECKLFTEMGHDVYSLGAYTNPHDPADKKRPAISEMKYDDHFVSLAGRYSKDDLHEEQVEYGDVIIVMHIVDWIEKNWEKIKHKKVIWRSIGQSASNVESRLAPFVAQGLKIVRYSPREKNIPRFVGEDTMIRFYKDPEEFKDWTGMKNAVMTVGQSIAKRGPHCNFGVFQAATSGFPKTVFGPDNADIPESVGAPDYEDLKQALRDFKVFFFTGTQPASYTLGFMEAFMTGIPIVAIGPGFANSIYNLNTYEVQEFIENGINGFCSDNIAFLKESISKLLLDDKLAKKISTHGREKAIQLFGKETIKKDWERFFKSL